MNCNPNFLIKFWRQHPTINPVWEWGNLHSHQEVTLCSCTGNTRAQNCNIVAHVAALSFCSGNLRTETCAKNDWNITENLSGVCLNVNLPAGHCIHSFTARSFSLGSYVHFHAPDIWGGDGHRERLRALVWNLNPAAGRDPLPGQSLPQRQALPWRAPRHPLPQRPRRQQQQLAPLSAVRAKNRRGQAADAPHPVPHPASRLLPSLR